jgi:hypothetical protein
MIACAPNVTESLSRKQLLEIDYYLWLTRTLEERLVALFRQAKVDQPKNYSSDRSFSTAKCRHSEAVHRSFNRIHRSSQLVTPVRGLA